MVPYRGPAGDDYTNMQTTDSCTYVRTFGWISPCCFLASRRWARDEQQPEESPMAAAAGSAPAGSHFARWFVLWEANEWPGNNWSLLRIKISAFQLAITVMHTWTQRRNICARIDQQSCWKLTKARLVWVLKFNKHCSTFVLFDKKFLILDYYA
jgi:hypothetical protein